MSEFVQVGVTALRDPATGEMLPSVPLFIAADDLAKGPVPQIQIGELSAVLAEKMKQYVDGCKREGVKI